jgi:hypothetical protein
MRASLISLIFLVASFGLGIASASKAELVGWWKLDEGFQNTFHDSSGYGHDGKIDPPNVNKVRWTTEGYKGGALQFATSTPPYTFCDAPLTPGLLNIRSATAAFWLNMPAVYQEWGIALILLGENADHSIEPTDTRGLLIADFADDGSPWVGYGDLISTNPLAVSEWQHVAVTYSADANMAVCYVDAVEVNDIPFDANDNILGVRIGGPRNRVQWRNFLGMLDEVVVYNEALSADAIRNLFLYGPRPTPKASNPQPADGATDVPLDASLSWDAGIYADKHDLYFGTDFNDVNEATPADPRGVLHEGLQGTDVTWRCRCLFDYGQTYYWRVDEVNDLHPDGPWKGDVWSFTTANFLIVDDFESYTDVKPGRVFDTWTDGWEVAENGAVVGYANPDLDAGQHYAETTNFHTGRQAMPFFYDNDHKYSQAYRLLSDGASDWTRQGVDSLSLWFRGYPQATSSFMEGPAGTYTLAGCGTDIWDRADEFFFACKELSGTGTISVVTKVESVENANEWVKAGVMIRDSLDAGARYAGVFITPGQGIRFQYRIADKDITNRQFAEGLTAPYWLKLERTTGGLVRAYHSPDGKTWTQFTLQTLSVSMPVYAGLAMTSHDPAVTAHATFSNVAVTGPGSTNPWTAQDIGLQRNIPDRLYVTLNDVATVYYDDPAATVIDSWTEWRIPLETFAGLGAPLTSVNKIAIGVGTQDDATQTGGTGLLFFDDIRLYRP